jgi:hypothetical protein
MDPSPPATRTGSRDSDEPVAAFVVAHPASAKQEIIVVPRIGCLTGKMSGGRYVSGNRVSRRFGIRSQP